MIQINSIYHDIQLSFGTSDVKRTTIKQNSEDTHILRIKLYDKQNNEITIDSNWNINISALKSDKTHILNTNNISVKDNTVYVTMTKQMLAASGTEHCELVLRDGEQVLFSDTFLIYVEPNVQDGSFIESSDEYDSIVDTLRHVEEKKDRVDQLTNEIEETKVDIDKTYDELKIAVEETNDLIQENEIIKSNEAERKHNEEIRQSQEAGRQTNTATAISNAEEATVNANNAAERANSATDDLQDKLASHHFVLTEDKDVAGGVPSLDDNAKVPVAELYDATTSNKGVTQLTDSVTSTSITTAATPNSVKTVNDDLIAERERAINADTAITINLNSEIARAKAAESTLSTNKLDKTTVATSSTLGLVKSGTDITVDSSGNVSVNDNSHNHTVSNISDLTATASELNVLDGITATTTELNYTDGVTNNIQMQLDSKAPIASPALTGIPTAPTASTGTNTTQIATTAFVQTTVSNHNVSTTAHTDIRDLITELTTRLNALVDSDDTTLDQLSEIVSYIKSNRTLIENVTTNKVNVADVIDNLTSTATNKPLSAKQGKVLNDLISALTTTVNTKIDTVNGDTHIGVSRSGTTATITHKDVSRSNTTSTASPSHGGTFTAVKTVTSDSKGHVTGVDTETVTLPAQYTHPNYTARTGVPTANQTPAFGDTFNVTQPVSDATGHITAMNSRTITIPSTVATSSALGLVKSGTDITVDSSGNVSVNDDSHNHIISNVDGLQSALDGKLPQTTLSSVVNFDTLTTTGVYHIKFTGGTNQPSGNHGTLIVDFTVGTPYQLWIPDNVSTYAYKRNCTSESWGSWSQMKFTDTTYSAGTGLALSGTTFSHSNSITAGTAQGDATKTLAFGSTFAIPTVTYDAQGHITGKGTTTMTMPSVPTSVSGNAGTATKLATSRTIQTNLASTSSASFDGSANVTPGVTGTLPVANGGTGQTTANAAANSFINSLGTGSSTPQDADYYVSQYVGGGTTTTTYHRRPMSALWEYIKSKISSVLGLTADSYGGNSATATKSTQDSAGQQINTTYIKGLSASGKTITYTKGDGTTGTLTTQDTVTTATTTGSGNAVTSITASNGALTVTKGSTFLTAHPTITTSTDSTSTASPSAGGTFTAIDSVTRDSNGHVTKVNTKTITLPNTAVTVDSALSPTSTNPVQNKLVYSALSGKSDTGHTHSYAGSSSAGGSATSAVKLDSSAGSTTQPVYFSSGKPVACGYDLSTISTNASDALQIALDNEAWIGKNLNLGEISKYIIEFDTFDDLTTSIKNFISSEGSTDYGSFNLDKHTLYPICTNPGTFYQTYRKSDIGSLDLSGNPYMHYVGLTLDFQFCPKIICYSPTNETMISGENLSIKNLKMLIYDNGTISKTHSKIYLYSDYTNDFLSLIKLENCDITYNCSNDIPSGYYVKLVEIAGDSSVMNNKLIMDCSGHSFIYALELSSKYSNKVIDNELYVNATGAFSLNIKSASITSSTTYYTYQFITSNRTNHSIYKGPFQIRTSSSSSYSTFSKYSSNNLI